MTSAAPRVPTIGIIGGGVTGGAVAWHLAQAPAAARILLFEPRTRLGAGLAYGGGDPNHRINVPATRMSLIPHDAEAFPLWLAKSGEGAADPGARCGDDLYPTRAAFGRHMDDQLRPLVAAGHIRHVAQAVTSAEKNGDGWRLTAASGEDFEVDYLALATTHPDPGLLRELAPFVADPRLIANGLADDALQSVEPDENVLIVGSGLTGADIVCTLDARAHRGKITMISRRGLRSHGHPPQPWPPEGDFISQSARGATSLLRSIRRAVRKAESEGRSWHPVLDAVRAQGGPIWEALDVPARRRVLRHLRPYWDVHRFRAAPQVDAALDRRIAQGLLVLRRARLGAVARAADGFFVTLRLRHGREVVEKFDRIVVATGPAHGDVIHSQPYLQKLAAQGLIAPDEVGLGLQTTTSGRAIGADGEVSATLFIAGPLARGTFGELMGLPQVTLYARFIAEEVGRALAGAPEGRFVSLVETREQTEA
ncbi:hypothetical protein CCR94_10095 [Rhodoblastus sphagnicola]|uniref:FAD-dependent urate hydroxylase HpyO/Asp monooxygenase CreE-like FAD/NAD(P)-binding domain-containing protein n=1 Tax=Rhodoblastus sphagnicola TaxID=333368 RepID=A0A2S6N958_9HYPH|nr:FAD/NAD(P)-binding protein [Rhodoblastus sphagnicola]MBB4200814.1 putative NAD(P)/FAD-binding protein YdhS [Rhodoblastus sphagnicola]PPQ31152.1 hypothetical protein CCR94_10095 [Rhodoblastus sphagnicola]